MIDVALVGTLPDADATDHRGPERTTIGLANALNEIGVDVTVVADEGDPDAVDVEAHVLRDGDPPGIGRMLRFNRDIYRRGLLADADIVHTWRPCYRADVMSWHGIGMEPEIGREFAGTFDRRRLVGAKIHRAAKRLTARRAQTSVVTAPGNYRYAARYNVPVDDMVPVGVEERFRQPDTYNGDIDVLSVSRIEQRKQPQFVDTHTPDGYDTAIVGGATDEGLAESLSDRWVGRVEDDDLLAYYRRAGVFVLPSFFEPFGLTAAEAMAAETPVVVSDRAAIAPWVREYGLGTVYEYGDVESYHNALTTAFESRERYATNAAAFVERRLRWTEIAERYAQRYRRIDALASQPTESLDLFDFPELERDSR